VIAKAAATPATHNKPVLINSITRTPSTVATRTVTPRSNSRTSAEMHQGWPNENVNGSSRAQTRAPARVAEANRPTTPSASTRFEPSIHSTTPSMPFPNGTRGVEQPNNYSGFRPQASASSAPTHNAGAASYGGGHSSPAASPYSGGHSSGAAASPSGGSHSAGTSSRTDKNH
jgi:hypothetical protein